MADKPSVAQEAHVVDLERVKKELSMAITHIRADLEALQNAILELKKVQAATPPGHGATSPGKK